MMMNWTFVRRPGSSRLYLTSTVNEKTDASCNSRPVRIYNPKNVPGPLPLMVYFPGGGYFTGNLDTEDAHCRYFAIKTPCIVITLDYEKVGNPGINIDHIINQNGIPFVAWARKRASELGASSKTLLCGGSAGAFLSAQITYALMQKGNANIDGLLLPFAVCFPYTYGENGKHRDKFKAWEENGHAQVPILSRPLAEYIWSYYDADFNSPAHFPGLAEDLSRWPPTYIVSAEKDVFRDDGRLFHELLLDAGVASKLDYYEGLPHYFHVFPALAVAHEMMAKAVEGVHFVLQDRKQNGI